MLTTILPGLRDLRTPLATGYMWLVAFYLVFAELLNEARQKKTFLMEQVTTFVGVLGTTTALGAVTFLAYLIGASTALNRVSLQVGEKPEDGKEAWTICLRRKVVAIAKTNYLQVDQKFNDTVEKIVKKSFDNSQMRPRRFFEAVDPKKNTFDVDAEAFEMTTDTENDVVDFVKNAINEESVVIENTLHNEGIVGWDDYDRERAESLWRLSLVWPLLAIVTAGLIRFALTTGISPWLLLLLPLIVVGYGFVLNLYLRGFVKAASAESTLRMAVVLKPHISPTLERIQEYERTVS